MGGATNAMGDKVDCRVLRGEAVKEVDEAREPQAETLISSRTRQRQYDSIGRVTAEIDASDCKVEFAYNIHGEKLGTRNARGTVFFDRRDRNGTTRFQGLLRTASPAGPGEYASLTRSGTVARPPLQAHPPEHPGPR